MEKTNNTINTQSNAKEIFDTSTVQGELMSHVLEAYEELKAKESRDTSNEAKEALTKEKNILEKRIDILHNRLAEVAKHFLAEQVQDVIYKTHDQNICDFRDVVETHYSKVSDLWHTLDNDQKELLSDILHLIGVSTGMLLSEVYKAGIKACNTHMETLESLNNLEDVDVSKVFYDALPTNRY